MEPQTPIDVQCILDRKRKKAFYVDNWLDPSGLRSRVWIYGGLLAKVAGSNSSRGMYVCLSRVCYQVEVFATGRSIFQRSPIVCGEPE
jgi:hypothetical protein